MIQIIGSVVVAVCVFGGYMWSGGHIAALWHPSEIVIICGAALGAFMISNPPKVSKQAFTQALQLPKGARYQRDDYVDLLKLVYDILVKMRKEGLLAIEADVEKPEDSPLFKKYPKVLEDHHMSRSSPIACASSWAARWIRTNSRACSSTSWRRTTRKRMNRRTRCRRWPMRCRGSASWPRCWAS
jgi:hypothetical protein